MSMRSIRLLPVLLFLVSGTHFGPAQASDVSHRYTTGAVIAIHPSGCDVDGSVDVGGFCHTNKKSVFGVTLHDASLQPVAGYFIVYDQSGNVLYERGFCGYSYNNYLSQRTGRMDVYTDVSPFLTDALQFDLQPCKPATTGTAAVHIEPYTGTEL